MALRLTALGAVAVLAACTAYALHDRNHLAAEIRARQATYASCLRRGDTKAACTLRYSWSHLAGEREGDLLGLPFFAFGAVLIIILAVRVTIGPPASSQTAGLDVTSTVAPE